MNTAALARTAYASASAIAPVPRDAEYRALAEVTRRLHAVRPGPANFPDLAEAVRLNLKLWTLLAADVADDRNALPVALRAQIFGLAEFTRTHSRAVLREGADPAPLVELNRSIMRGLRPENGDA